MKILETGIGDIPEDFEDAYLLMGRIVAGIGQTAARDTERAKSLRFIIARAEGALAVIETRSSTFEDEGQLDLLSEEAYQIIRRFCYSKLNCLFSIRELRAHLEINDVSVSAYSDDELLEYFDRLSAEILADLQRIFQIKLTRYETGGETAFCEITPWEVSDPTDELPAGNAMRTAEETAAARTGHEDGELVDESISVVGVGELEDYERLVSGYLGSSGGGMMRKDLIRLLSSNDTDGKHVIVLLDVMLGQGILHKYRAKGAVWLTLNQEYAESRREEARRLRSARHGVDRNYEVQDSTPLDIGLAAEVLGVFTAPNTHVQVLLTIKELWTRLNDNGQARLNDEYNKEAGRRLKLVVRQLARHGLMIHETRGQKRGARSRSATQHVLKVGLPSQEVKETIQGLQEEGTLLKYLAELQ